MRVTVGEVDAFLRQRACQRDPVRRHGAAAPLAGQRNRGRAPSRRDRVAAATTAMLDEPRYGERYRPRRQDVEQRALGRHTLGRRRSTSPCSTSTTSATASATTRQPSGRRWLRDRVGEAGLDLEERSEGMSPSTRTQSPPTVFPGPQGNAHQLALLLADRLIRSTTRAAGWPASPSELRRDVAEVLARYPAGPEPPRGRRPRAARRRAVDLLVGFGLARRDDDGTIAALPALARYRVGEPPELRRGRMNANCRRYPRPADRWRRPAPGSSPCGGTGRDVHVPPRAAAPAGSERCRQVDGPGAAAAVPPRRRRLARRLTSAAKSRGRLFERVMTGTDDASRAGFAWVEFRHGEDMFTIGARLRASPPPTRSTTTSSLLHRRSAGTWISR